MSDQVKPLEMCNIYYILLIEHMNICLEQSVK